VGQPLLSIYIPSWNRAGYFNRLIQSIQHQITPDVEVVASLNPPNDGYDLPDWLRVVRQRIDINGRVNITLGPVLCEGKYIWMLGDDEIVLNNGIGEVLRTLNENPDTGIAVMWDGEYPLGVTPGSTFHSYRQFGDTVYSAGRGYTLSALTLISATVFRREAFDLALSLKKMDTMYGQHYAMLNNLWREPVSVVAQGTFRAAIARESASVLANPKELEQHMRSYPQVLEDLMRWLNNTMGSHYEFDKFWYPGCGFDK
jgi:glycosyltransferase involved in cell wall biosynthesis